MQPPYPALITSRCICFDSAPRVVLGLLDAAGDKMERVYALEKKDGFFDFPDKDVRALLYERTVAGAAMLRDIPCRAWTQSSPTPEEIVPSPIDLYNPRSNPEKESAPD
jgi:hypothetical protein